MLSLQSIIQESATNKVLLKGVPHSHGNDSELAVLRLAVLIPRALSHAFHPSLSSSPLSVLVLTSAASNLKSIFFFLERSKKRLPVVLLFLFLFLFQSNNRRLLHWKNKREEEKKLVSDLLSLSVPSLFIIKWCWHQGTTSIGQKHRGDTTGISSGRAC